VKVTRKKGKKKKKEGRKEGRKERGRERRKEGSWLAVWKYLRLALSPSSKESSAKPTGSPQVKVSHQRRHASIRNGSALDSLPDHSLAGSNLLQQ
jgi:hypothetical protein